MIGIASSADVLGALARARDVVLSAYVLRAGPLQDALVAAARRGAHVRVVMQADPYGDTSGELTRDNASAAAALRAAGANVEALPRATRPFHMKAAICDGVAFIDDRNWAGDGAETILRDDERDDVAVLRSALAGRPRSDPHLATTKRGALALEVRAIAGAGDAPLDVASESFGPGPVASALRARAARGAPTRLIVARREFAGPKSSRERRALERLAAAGVAVRIADADEKMAVGTARAWVGSANATGTHPSGDQVDWGMTTRVPAVVVALRSAFARYWAAATPLERASPKN